MHQRMMGWVRVRVGVLDSSQSQTVVEDWM